jgi:phosphoglycerate dehydrogenase-like enzyme
MINAKFLNYCKKDKVYIVNVARGGLLDYDAVLAGLDSGKVGGCGLDVQFYEPFDPEDPFATHPNVYLTPHVAGVTETSYRAMAKVVAEEVRRVARGERPTIQLNSEEEMKKEGAAPRVG